VVERMLMAAAGSNCGHRACLRPAPRAPRCDRHRTASARSRCVDHVGRRARTADTPRNGGDVFSGVSEPMPADGDDVLETGRLGRPPGSAPARFQPEMSFMNDLFGASGPARGERQGGALDVLGAAPRGDHDLDRPEVAADWSVASAARARGGDAHTPRLSQEEGRDDQRIRAETTKPSH